MAQERMIEGGRCSGQACAAERAQKGKLGLCDDGYSRNGGCRGRGRCHGILALVDVRGMGQVEGRCNDNANLQADVTMSGLDDGLKNNIFLDLTASHECV